MTSAPLSTAYTIASAPEKSSPPYGPRNLAGMIVTFQLTPATPNELLPCAPMIPATWVPWRSPSEMSKTVES